MATYLDFRFKILDLRKKSKIQYPRSNIRKSAGFTLIELLVVIAIIGILTAIGTFAYSSAQMRARDARRKSDLQMIQSALELYRYDNGNYPCVLGWWCGSVWITHDSIAQFLTPKFITKIPADPKGGFCGGSALYSVFSQEIGSSGKAKGYTLFTILENSSDSDAKNPKPPPAAITTGNSSDDYVTFTPNQGNCPGTTYNYWINNL